MIQFRDVEVLFYDHHNGEAIEQRVAITMGGGCAQSWLTLQEFCELMAECRKEISVRHWQPREGGGEDRGIDGRV